MQTPQKYRIVTRDAKGQLRAQETHDLRAWCELNGIEIVGLNRNKAQRRELYNQPLLDGFCGPMWDGDAIRYEDAEAYRQLSA